MPASYGLRSRPALSSNRGGTAHFVASTGIVDVVPRAALFPLLALAAFVLISATTWVYDIHTSDQWAEIEAPQLTGTIQTR